MSPQRAVDYSNHQYRDRLARKLVVSKIGEFDLKFSIINLEGLSLLFYPSILTE